MRRTGLFSNLVGGEGASEDEREFGVLEAAHSGAFGLSTWTEQ